MNYYKIFTNTINGDVILHYKEDYGISLNSLVIGKKFDNWDDRFSFYYDKTEGNIWNDCVCNDKGWFVISERLKNMLSAFNTDIQFFNVAIKDMNDTIVDKKYYIANIIKNVDAYCPEKSHYRETTIKGKGTIHIVSKYGIYEKKVNGADLFKLSEHNNIPTFASERFKNAFENEGMTGLFFREIAVEHEGAK